MTIEHFHVGRRMCGTASSAQTRTPVDVFAAAGLPRALCLGSKSRYRASRRKHFFVPNAHVFCHSLGLVWWGDLDLWVHADRMERAARTLGCRLYVLPECRAVADAPELPFDEVERQALWHTGGRVRASRRLIRLSGLGARELKLFLGVSHQRLWRPQRPYVALQINQKLRELDDHFGPLARHYGFKKWGDWFRSPHPKLMGRSPFETLCAGNSINPSELFEDIYSNEKLLQKYSSAVVGLSFSLATRIHLDWPIVERRRRR